MNDEWLAAAGSALNEDMSQWHREYGLDLTAEVKRLRALTTVDDAMVERAAREAYGPKTWDRLLKDGHGVFAVQLSAHRALIRAALEAALNPKEEA